MKLNVVLLEPVTRQASCNIAINKHLIVVVTVCVFWPNPSIAKL